MQRSSKNSVEYWDAYDREGHLLEDLILDRELFPYPQGYYHLAVNVWVRHTDGSWLFVKRSSHKTHYPNYYEAGAGGSVFRGETSLQAASRELTEETGLVAKTIHPLFSFTEEKYHTHFDTYLAVVDGDKAISYQAGETSAHAWVSKDELPAFLASHLVFDNQKEQILAYLGKC